MTIQETLGWDLIQTYKELPDIFYSEITPEIKKAPRLIVYNQKLATELGLTLNAENVNTFTENVAGNKIPVGAEPIAQAYAGHQFGHFTMLGDGRNILLGEQRSPSGKRFDIVLKGAGRTTYSRGGDGKAQLAPMLREYLISEAMHALGIATTRSLAVVSTGEAVIRRRAMPGAVLTRVAKSHLRVGTFEFALYWGEKAELQALADYTLQRLYPEIRVAENRYEKLLYKVIAKQAQLIAQWQLVGFIHGVMNTDNMLLSGETIDYGPCAFLDVYDPSTVYSSIDDTGRYAYKNQPYIAEWNLARFAETLLPLFPVEKEAAIALGMKALKSFFPTYKKHWLTLAMAKLGIQTVQQNDEQLVQELFTLMENYAADFTNTFYQLTIGELSGEKLFASEAFQDWYQKWQERLKLERRSATEIKHLMMRHNPAVIPRNYYVEVALEAALKGDLTEFQELFQAVTNPYAYDEINEKYQQVPKDFHTTYRTFCGT